MKSYLLIFFLFTTFLVSSQCSDPLNIVTTSLNHASCPGQGKIRVTKMSPILASYDPMVPADYYQYSLFNTTLNTLVYGWQNTDEFLNLGAGIYEIRVQKICSTNPFISNYITKSVTINNTETPPSISAVKILRRDKCNNGAFEVTALGSGPLEYALINSISEPEPVATYVRARQTSKRFENLSAGTYFVRVYNVCGSAVSQAVVVDPELTVSDVSPTIFSFLPKGCDSLGFGFNVQNYSKNTAFFPSDTKVKGWIRWPNNVTDSLELFNQSSAAVLQTNRSHYFSTNLINIDPNYDPSLPWPDNLTIPGFTFEYGFVDACGVSYSKTFTYVKTNTRELILNTFDNSLRTTCDSVSYGFRISYSGGGGISTTHGFANYSGAIFSVDGGVTWKNPYTHLSKIPGGAGNTSSVEFTVKRGNTVNLIFKYCGQTLNKTFTASASELLTTDLSGYIDESCFDKGSIRIRKYNAFGVKVGLEMISAPAGQAIIPYFNTGILNTGIAYTDIPQYTNILPGQYTIKIWDTLDVDCPRSREVTITVVPFTFDFTYAVLCNQNIDVTLDRTIGANPGNVRVHLINELGAIVVGGPDGIAGSTGLKATILGSDLNALPAGNYKIRVGRYINDTSTLTVCSFIEKVWVKSATSSLNLNNSVFVSGCLNGGSTISAVANGGKAPYIFSLFDANNVQVTSPQNDMYNNLDPTKVYKLSVIDNCGAIVNRLISSNKSPDMIVPGHSTMPCAGDNVSLVVPNYPQATFAWTKDNVLLPSETSNSVNLPNIQPADAGVYNSTITLGACIVDKALLIDPTQCGGVLAIELIDFNALCNSDGSVNILWKTASEINSKYFKVQKSSDLINWQTIDVIPSKGNSNIINSYNSIDRNPFVGITYYQLIERDVNEVEKEFAPIGINCEELTPKEWSVFPNPTNGDFKVAYQSDEKVTADLQVMDVNGRLIISQKLSILEGTNNFIVSENLVSGMYFITIVINKKELKPIKLIVN